MYDSLEAEIGTHALFPRVEVKLGDTERVTGQAGVVAADEL